MKQHQDFTQGPILPVLLRFALPVLLVLLLQAMYGAVDLQVVGRFGTAADISIKGVSVEDVAAYARSIMLDWGGVGSYKKQGFVHVDVRETMADWNG